jgi:hypothetical protein
LSQLNGGGIQVAQLAFDETGQLRHSKDFII